MHWFHLNQPSPARRLCVSSSAAGQTDGFRGFRLTGIGAKPKHAHQSNYCALGARGCFKLILSHRVSHLAEEDAAENEINKYNLKERKKAQRLLIL